MRLIPERRSGSYCTDKYRTELPMSVELPDKIITKVTYSEPGVRGDTATRTLKQATVETVPL